MSWSERKSLSMVVRLAVVIVAAGLTAGCFEPLYGRNPAAPETDSVRDKLAEVDIPVIPTRQGSPEARSPSACATRCNTISMAMPAPMRRPIV